MNTLALAFTLVSVGALLALPRRWAPFPLLAGACYMTLGQGVELGPFTFTVIRILVAGGVARVILRRETLHGGLNRLDWLMVVWSMWACISSAFHESPLSALVYRLGLVYNACGIYFLLRIFCHSVDDVVRLCRTTACVLGPVAVAMLYERASLHNVFSMFGGVDATPMIREGRIRASGPFAHAILAGTIGAVSMPLMIGLWRYSRLPALIGVAVCVTIIVASASSGPVMSVMFALSGIMMWVCRRHMRAFRWSASCSLVALSLIMKAPVYYLIARIDIVGGSTGWHRSRLIESALEHINEWWFAGTDYTRHWMAEGMASDPTQVDITNHYLRMGVIGGLPLILLFVAALGTAFSIVGKQVNGQTKVSERHRFVIWALGCSLFAHAATFISVSYFDQSVVFFYLTLAAIGSTSFHDASAELKDAPAHERPQARSPRKQRSLRPVAARFINPGPGKHRAPPGTVFPAPGSRHKSGY